MVSKTDMSYSTVWQMLMMQKIFQPSCLQQIWESLVPGFYSWFFKNYAQKFKECLTRLAQEQLEINTRYYNNNLELKHRQQKKKLRDLNISGDISQVSAALDK